MFLTGIYLIVNTYYVCVMSHH